MDRHERNIVVCNCSDRAIATKHLGSILVRRMLASGGFNATLIRCRIDLDPTCVQIKPTLRQRLSGCQAQRSASSGVKGVKPTPDPCPVPVTAPIASSRQTRIRYPCRCRCRCQSLRFLVVLCPHAPPQQWSAGAAEERTVFFKQYSTMVSVRKSVSGSPASSCRAGSRRTPTRAIHRPKYGRSSCQQVTDLDVIVRVLKQFRGRYVVRCQGHLSLDVWQPNNSP